MANAYSLSLHSLSPITAAMTDYHWQRKSFRDDETPERFRVIIQKSGGEGPNAPAERVREIAPFLFQELYPERSGFLSLV
jgi:hypothetical protein